MAKEKEVTAGLLMYRVKNGQLEIFLEHPGGPFFKNKDNDYWSIPKGLVDKGEDLLQTAKREFEEETGIKPPEDGFIPLDSIVYKNKKIVHAWAFKTDIQDEKIETKSNLFEIEWPPKSGKMQKFPESDKAEFFTPDIARKKINGAQTPFIERLEKILGV